jgi:hypothetical protein
LPPFQARLEIAFDGPASPLQDRTLDAHLKLLYQFVVARSELKKLSAVDNQH